MTPLEVLYEVDDLASFYLPEELADLYGGGLGFAEPALFANFVSTLDGVVAIPSIPECAGQGLGTVPDRIGQRG